jgi:hypothetical protein
MKTIRSLLSSVLLSIIVEIDEFGECISSIVDFCLGAFRAVRFGP